MPVREDERDGITLEQSTGRRRTVLGVVGGDEVRAIWVPTSDLFVVDHG
ncbi:MAG: hypothetical protein ACRDM7_18390 [Thermoleophilaceae bacterium]